MLKSCIQCGKTLSEKRGDARFCSLSCKNKHSYKGRLGEVMKEVKATPKLNDPPPGKTLESGLNGINKNTDERQEPTKKTSGNIDADFFNELMDEKVFHVENKLEMPTEITIEQVNEPDEYLDDVQDELADKKTKSQGEELKNTLPEKYISKEVTVANHFYQFYQNHLKRLQQQKQSIEQTCNALASELNVQQSRDGQGMVWTGAIVGTILALNSKKPETLDIPSHPHKRKQKKHTAASTPSPLATFLKSLVIVAVGTGIGYTAKQATKDWREKDRQTKIRSIQNRLIQLRQDYQNVKAEIEKFQKTLRGTSPYTTTKVCELNPAYTQALYGIANPEIKAVLKSQKPLPKNNIHAQAITFKSDRIIKATELGKQEYKGLHFKGLWREFFGLPSLNFHILIHGNSGEGKSTFCLWFARYLAENFGRVLYVSAEEGLNKTFHDKLKSCEAEVDNLYILDAGTGDELMQEVETNEFHFIILDSLHDMEIDAHKMKLIFERYPHTAFVCIDQNNKKGDLLGANEKKHMVDVVVNVKNYSAETTKNRFIQKGMVFKTADFTTNAKIHLKDPKKGGEGFNRGYDLDSDRRGII